MSNLKIKQKGFSIVELAIALGVVGIIGTGMTLMYSEQKTRAMEMQDEAKLELVKKAIIQFTKDNKYMPCPDTDADGFENRVAKKGALPAIAGVTQANATPSSNYAPQLPATQSVAAQPAVSNIDINVCKATSGTVPFHSLELTKSQVTDSVGDLVAYYVDQGTDDADSMLNCPTNSACFFNNNQEPDLASMGLGLTPAGNEYVMPYESLPAFSNATLPLMGALGPNNLRICSDDSCSKTLKEGLVAVLVAHNEDGHTLNDDENENIDGDPNFVYRAVTSSGDLFNDQIIGVSANDVRLKREPRVAQFVNIINPAPPGSQTGQDLTGMGNLLGSTGTNIATDDVTFDVNTQTFNFGNAAAGDKVVLKFKTEAYGSWDQPSSPSSSITSDSAYVKANGDEVVDLRYDYTDNSQDGYKQVSFEVLRDRWYSGFRADGSAYSEYIRAGDIHTTYTDVWYETHEMTVEADANGDVNLEFGVGTTANYENIDFTDIELYHYKARKDFPAMPTVNPIDGISETDDLNTDKEVYINDEN